MFTLASIYLASLSNAYRHAYLARSVIQPVEEEGRKMNWKNSLLGRSAGTIFRLHACGTDADCVCIRVNYDHLALPRRRAHATIFTDWR